MESLISVEVARSIANGAKKVAKFKGAVRNTAITGLEVGDTWTFPDNYEIYERKLNGNTVQYIHIELEDGKVKQFYPTTFTKMRQLVDEDGTLTGERAVAKGTASEEFQKYGNIEDAMNAMKGKRVSVTEVENVRCLRFGTTQVMTTGIPTIDFVQASKK